MSKRMNVVLRIEDPEFDSRAFVESFPGLVSGLECSAVRVEEVTEYDD